MPTVKKKIMFLIIKWETKLSTKELNQRKKFQEKKVRNNAIDLEKKRSYFFLKFPPQVFSQFFGRKKNSVK